MAGACPYPYLRILPGITSVMVRGKVVRMVAYVDMLGGICMAHHPNSFSPPDLCASTPLTTSRVFAHDACHVPVSFALWHPPRRTRASSSNSYILRHVILRALPILSSLHSSNRMNCVSVVDG